MQGRIALHQLAIAEAAAPRALPHPYAGALPIENAADESWHTTHSAVDLRQGGKFLSRMEAKDGSAGFDFEGTYTRVQPHQAISYRMTDAREVDVDFVDLPDGVLVRSTFDAETENPEEMQRDGWQAISDNFGRHVERRVADLGEARAALGPF